MNENFEKLQKKYAKLIKEHGENLPDAYKQLIYQELLEVQYNQLLAEQYKQATGIKNDDINSASFMSELNEWLRIRREISKKYLDLLINEMKLTQITKSRTSEIGKGGEDSIVKSFNTTKITPYSHSFTRQNITINVVPAWFLVYKGRPYMIKNRKDIQPVTATTKLTFMTQNPYTLTSIEDWDKLHNSGKYNIIYGIYGNIYDKDLLSKLAGYNELREKLEEGTYIESDYLSGDTYCNIIASKDTEKQKTTVFPFGEQSVEEKGIARTISRTK